MKDFQKRIIKVNGYNVEVVNFGYASYFYPTFNGNAEFKVNHKGFRELSSYLRFIRYAENICQLQASKVLSIIN